MDSVRPRRTPRRGVARLVVFAFYLPAAVWAAWRGSRWD